MDELAGARIAGVYTTEQARSLPDRTGFSVALEALNGALADAGMTIDEIDGFSSSVSGWPPNDGHWARQLRRQWKWSDAGVGPDAVVEAASLITSGYLNAVALVYASVRDTTGTTGGVAPWLQGLRSAEWTGWPGSIPNQPVQFGLVAQRYIHEVGEQARYAMADVAASTRNFGSINPDAVYSGRGPFTAEDVLASRPIAGPLTLLMCSAVTDGGCAVILSRKDRANGNGNKGVHVVCGASLTHTPTYYEPPTLEGYYELGQHYRDVVTRARVNMDDIDAVEFYDHFTSHVLLQYEQFGFCGKGEAPDLVKAGEMRLGGKFPTCTDGGNLSFSHPGNPIVFRYIEAVRQLRGEAKDLCPDWAKGIHTYEPTVCRMVRDARLAFVSSSGSATIMGGMLVLARD